MGHLRDVRRLVVAMSRARLGLYVFCRRSLFEQCYELQPTFQLLLLRPDRLALSLNEVTAFTDRRLEDTGQSQLVSGIDEMANIVNYKMHKVYEVSFLAHKLITSFCLIAHHFNCAFSFLPPSSFFKIAEILVLCLNRGFQA